MSFKRSCPYSKSIDGLQEGNFTSIEVNGDADIEGNLSVEGNGFVQGNLTVIGNINSGGGGGSTTMDYFEATDASNQFRAQSSTIDFKSSTNAAPTFRFKNNINETFPTKIEVGEINLTDGSNQILALNALLDIKVDSATPVVRFKDNLDTTEGSVVQAGNVQLSQHKNAKAVSFQKNTQNSANAEACIRSETHGNKFIEMSAHAASHSTYPDKGTVRTSNLSALEIITDSTSAPVTTKINNVTKLDVTNTAVAATVPITTTDTTQSNTHTQGSIVTAGGLGVAKNVRINGDVKIANARMASNGNDLFIEAQNAVIVQRPSSATTNNEVVNGTVDFFIRNNTSYPFWIANKSSDVVTHRGAYVNEDTTQAINTTSGAIYTAGGIGIAKNCIVGGNLQVGGTLTAGSITYASTSSGTFAVTNASGTTFTVASITDSTNVFTGCAVFEGGLGIKKNVHVGGEHIVIRDGTSISRIIATGANTDRLALFLLNCLNGSLALFLNGPGRLGDGGANTATLRNEAGGGMRVLTNISGTEYGFSISDTTTHQCRSVNLNNPGLFFNDNKPQGTGSSTHAHFQRDLNSGEETLITIGESLTNENAAYFGFKTNASGPEREAKLGIYGVSTGISVKQAGMSINGGSFFGYTESTFTPTLFVNGGGAYTDFYANGYYTKIGKQCTINFSSKRSILPAISSEPVRISLPFTAAYDCDFLVSTKTRITGESSTQYKILVKAMIRDGRTTMYFNRITGFNEDFTTLVGGPSGNTFEIEGQFTYITE